MERQDLQIHSGERVVSGVLVTPCVVETDDCGTGDSRPGFIGFAAGSRIRISIDESLPSLSRDEDFREIAEILDGS